jgi:hypothetical protein
VPEQHRQRRTEHNDVDDVVPEAVEPAADEVGQQRQRQRRQGARGHAGAQPTPARRQRARGRGHDADEERRFQCFAKDDQGCGEHGAGASPYSATTTPWALASWYSPTKA